jgi:hypothetical protein
MPALSVVETADLAATARDLLAHTYSKTATVYTRGAGGAFDVVAKSNLAVRLSPPGSAAPGTGRAVLIEDWTIAWHEIAYAMPDAAQVAIDGLRWTIQAGTQAYREAGSTLIERSCRLTRAKT